MPQDRPTIVIFGKELHMPQDRPTIVIFGNPFEERVRAVGPFDNQREGSQWATEKIEDITLPWVVVQLEDPDVPSYRGSE